MSKKILPLILILVFAFALRTYQLTDIPPGLTHDEANHGRDSINVLDGVLLFYFPLNYGSEPLYNYVVAGAMALIGENTFTLRLVNVASGLLTIAATYLWANWAFGRRTALIAAALLAVAFWPVATSRQALRASILPFLATAAVIFFWQILRTASAKNLSSEETPIAATEERERLNAAQTKSTSFLTFAGFAVFVAATLHTYLAARVLWLLFPVFLLYLALIRRPLFRQVWRPVLAGLIIAGLLVIPMFAYIQAHPEAETRLEMLDRPLQNLVSGNLGPILANSGEAFLAFFWPGNGDHFLAYNIPGRPVFGLLSAIFFLSGVILCLWHWKRPPYTFLLLWFVIGIAPSLVTGPEANTTRNIGALPAVYLLPAVGFMAVTRRLSIRWGRPGKTVAAIGLGFWLLLVAGTTVRDYFVRWANSAEVRAAYQQTLIKTLEYLDTSGISYPVVLSSVYPGAAHDPSIARVFLSDENRDVRWVDARFGMVFPAGESLQLLVPSSTPLHSFFANLAEISDRVQLRANDLDPSFELYNLDSRGWQWSDKPVNFGNAVTLLGARWSSDSVKAGEQAELITVWQVVDPKKVGPVVPPAFETDVVMFTHLLDDSGNILAQRDALEAPSWDWQVNDIIVQVHLIQVPAGTLPGTYEAITGIYDRSSGERLSVIDTSGAIVASQTNVVPLMIHEQ
jgi:4-amino-4-deoxy-L-arabinose transferase-like glycosyltransferase